MPQATRKSFAVTLVAALLTASGATATTAPLPWPALVRSDTATAGVAVASVPFAVDADSALLAALLAGRVQIGDCLAQGQEVARWPNGKPRRVLVRWQAPQPPAVLTGPWQEVAAVDSTAGWAFSYRTVAASADTIAWRTALRNLPLAQTQYEMHQLELRHGPQQCGIRLGLRRAGKLYWWQYVRADFLQRGPVFDLLRVGGPVYNEESTVQTDLLLVLYRSGVIEAYAHFANHQREGPAVETHGIPVLAFDIPGQPSVDVVLDGRQGDLAMGSCRLGLGDSRGYASSEHPGSLRTEDGVVVWQPWQDQAVWGELLVEAEGVPAHRVEWGIGEGQTLVSSQRAAGHHYWVAKWGDELLPKGLARSVRFILSLGGTPPAVARYQAPGWWQAQTGSLPLGGFLPTSWWSVPRTVAAADSSYLEPAPRGGFPFEQGRSSRSNDGTLAAGLLLLGRAMDRAALVQGALLPAYWWADIAIDHSDFTTHEIPKYSWQWVVQPYHRWLEPICAYGETGDPYLLETARFTADAFYRFFWTNRPHRFVGRDALAVADLLALWQTTGEAVYLQRAREILAEARRSYSQTEYYWPGHQSGSGPNGVARQQDVEYIPMVLGQLHAQLLREAGTELPVGEVDAAYAFLRQVAELVAARGGTGWVEAGTLLSYSVLTALSEHYPAEADRWLGQLNARNQAHGLPAAQSGARPYCTATASLLFDAWAWGARWHEGHLQVQPSRQLLTAPGAPSEATVSTPAGPVVLAFDGDRVTARGPVVVEVLPFR